MNAQLNPAVDQYIEELPEHVQKMAVELRQLIFEVSEQMKEEIKWGKPSYSWDGLVCYLQTAKSHINFGFYQGAQLDDRDGLLEGDGTKMRHIRVRKMDDIQPQAFKNLIWEAIEYNKKRQKG
ncbi:DUF1801 domain-containing protein [Planococcus shenhongbingii]|uniref:DUF1801 domain-containing protein n=1 Tax=Planococcus shenhongbingii TaxID=3058398 RepID=A0ABT8NET6_9BACL|nr:DUF1801 domain-containing protein [Planococcus sp. N017]MDN7246187.1 DUF1801 domain-containing protein [Planococcus sp. N017]